MSSCGRTVWNVHFCFSLVLRLCHRRKSCWTLSWDSKVDTLLLIQNMDNLLVSSPILSFVLPCSWLPFQLWGRGAEVQVVSAKGSTSRLVWIFSNLFCYPPLCFTPALTWLLELNTDVWKDFSDMLPPFEVGNTHSLQGGRAWTGYSEAKFRNAEWMLMVS